MDAKEFYDLHSDPVTDSTNRIAHSGYVFKCTACGKLSKDKYGMQALSSGYDVSCMLNSILVKADGT